MGSLTSAREVAPDKKAYIDIDKPTTKDKPPALSKLEAEGVRSLCLVFLRARTPLSGSET